MSPDIQKIERYSGFVMVTYSNYVEYIQFDNYDVLDTISKISINKPIRDIQQDVTHQRFLFVQTDTQINIYDCDGII